MLVTIQRQRSSKRVILGHACAQDLRDPSCERVEVERGEVRRPPAAATHLEAQGRADREEPGERAREAIEVGLHQGALLVLEELDVALPDEILGRPSSLRGRRPVLQDTASLVDRLEAGEDGRVVALRSQESAETFDPVLGGDVREVHPEDVVEDGVVRLADRVHVRHQQHFPATEAVRDVHVAGAIGVQPERKRASRTWCDANAAIPAHLKHAGRSL